MSSPDHGDFPTRHHRPDLADEPPTIDQSTEIILACVRRPICDAGSAARKASRDHVHAAVEVAAGDLVVPIQRTYPLDDVRAAFTELEVGHTAGRIVLIP
jgi:NADPH:quinone reductase-like Zn-dependent oxidoreductase